MLINIKGGTPLQKRYVHSIAKYCVHRLMPRIKYININICITNTTDTALGYCLPDDSDNMFRPREFIIEVQKKLPFREMLLTIAHELVHVKQYARGELYESARSNKHKWAGKWLQSIPSYAARPWEQEAHYKETLLYTEWLSTQSQVVQKQLTFTN